jgi:hypothetical protein
LLVVAIVGLGYPSAFADPPGPPADRTNDPAGARVRVVRPYSGDPLLVVTYPWKLHDRPSIEVQWLSDKEPAADGIRSLGFVNGFMHGQLSVDIYHCQDRGERVAASISRAERGVDMEIHAQRNFLSRSAVWVHCHFKTVEGKPQTRTVFCLLDDWAQGDRTLYLELPPRHYAAPGRLRIWMLRGADTVWMETIAWPGMPGAPQSPGTAAPPGPSQKPAVKKGADEDAAGDGKNEG